jgi:hypothetical protein
MQKSKKETKLKSAARTVVQVFYMFCIKLPIEVAKSIIMHLETMFYYCSALIILALVYVVVGYAAAAHGVDLPLHQTIVKIVTGLAAALRDKLHIPAAG